MSLKTIPRNETLQTSSVRRIRTKGYCIDSKGKGPVDDSSRWEPEAFRHDYQCTREVWQDTGWAFRKKVFRVHVINLVLYTVGMSVESLDAFLNKADADLADQGRARSTTMCSRNQLYYRYAKTLFPSVSTTGADVSSNAPSSVLIGVLMVWRTRRSRYRGRLSFLRMIVRTASKARLLGIMSFRLLSTSVFDES